MPRGPKMEPKRVQIQTKSRPLLASFFLPGTLWPPNGPRVPKWSQKGFKSKRFCMIFQYLSGTFSAAFPAMTPPPKPMHARARWSSRRKSLPACSDFRRELHPTSLDHAFGNALTSFRLPACIQVVGGWGWKGGAAMIRRRRLQYRKS